MYYKFKKGNDKKKGDLIMLSKWSAGHQSHTACDKYKAMPSIFFKYNFWI